MRSARRNSGFTLIEILISIGIVALLATMLVMAIAPSVEAAKVNATKAIIAQIEAQLQQRLASFNLIKDSEWEDLAVKVRKSWLPGGETSAPALVATKALVKKNRYLSAFPQRLQDLYGVDGVYNPPPTSGPPVTTAFQSDDPLIRVLRREYAKFHGIDESEVDPVVLESTISNAELLYQLLANGQAIKTESYNIDGIPSRYITDLDDDGFPEIRDAWGNEIRFYNAPTALIRSVRNLDADKNDLTTPAVDLTRGARLLYATIPGDNGEASPPKSTSRMLYIDPFDKKGDSASHTPIERYYDPQTYFSYLIVSAGPDGALGLHEPNAVRVERLGLPRAGELNELTDNLTNRQ